MPTQNKKGRATGFILGALVGTLMFLSIMTFGTHEPILSKEFIAQGFILMVLSGLTGAYLNS